MRFLIPLIVLAFLAITPRSAEARVFVSVTMHGRVNVCSAAYLQCDPRAVVWTPVGWMCPQAYSLYIRFHPRYAHTAHRGHRRGHVAHRPAQHRARATRPNHSRGRNGHRRGH